MKRNVDEKFKDYQIRRRNQNKIDKVRRKGRIFWDTATYGTLCKQPTENKTHQHEVDAYFRVLEMVEKAERV